MIILLASWVLLGLVFSGAGFLILWWWGDRGEGDWFLAFWIGWGASLVLLQIENFFLPILPWSWLLILPLACLGAALAWRRVRADAMRISWSHVAMLLFAIGCGIYLALRASHGVSTIDTGKYHLPAVQWAALFPAIPGMGNLNHALGSSSAYFLYAALLNTGVFGGRMYLVANGVLVWALVCQSLIQWRRWIESKGERPSRYALYYLLMLGPALFYAIDPHFVGVSPDTGAYVLAIVLVGEWIRWLESPPDESSREVRAGSILLLASLGIGIKQSFLVFGGLSLCLVLAIWRIRAGSAFAWKQLFLGACLCLAAIVPAFLRTALFSGYVLYPTTLGALPGEWRMPEETVQAYGYWVGQDARTPGLPKAVQETTVDWFPHWIETVPKYILVLVGLSLTIGIAILIRFAAGYSLLFPARLFFLPGLLILSLIFWFFSAPDVRFAGSDFWILGSVMALLAAEAWGATENQYGRFLLPLIGALVCGWAFVWEGGRQPLPSTSLFSLPNAMTNPSYASVPIGRNITMQVPVAGSVCWNIPQPCSEDYEPNLQLIDPNDLGRGFHIESSP